MTSAAKTTHPNLVLAPVAKGSLGRWPCRLLYGLVLLATCLAANFGHARDMKKSLVIVRVASQKPSVVSPWERRSIVNRKYIGSVVRGGMVLITAHAARHAKHIEMQRFGEDRLVPLKLHFVDMEANLALLAPLDSESLKGLVPIKLGDTIKPPASAKLLLPSPTGDMIEHKATLSDVQAIRSSTGRLVLPAYLLKVQAGGLGWSEPIVSGEELLGIASGQGSDYTYSIPSSVIRHFLRDRHDHRYAGFPALGLSFKPLRSENFRRLLGVADQKGGVRVDEILATSPFADVLEPDDVILEINGIPISRRGVIRSPRWGRIGIQAELARHYAGDQCSLKFARNGEIKVAKKNLKRFDSNAFKIPYARLSSLEPHLIFGGFLFQELSRGFLQAWGRDWLHRAPSRLVYLWSFQNPAQTQSKDRYVVLNRVLADRFNQGYTTLENAEVRQVNGRPIHSLDELRQALSHPIEAKHKLVTKIALGSGLGEVIVGYDGLEEAHDRIRKNLGVNSLAVFHDRR